MKLGYHAVYEDGYIAAIDAASIYGFDYIQPDLNVPAFFLDGLSGEELRNIRAYSEDKGVMISLHAPCDNISLFADFPLIRRGIMDEYKMILEKSNLLGARHITIHAGTRPGFKKAGAEADDYALEHAVYYENILCENLGEILKNSGNILVCLENHQLDGVVTSAADRLLSAGENADNGLFLTLDTAKVYKSGKLDRYVFEYMMSHNNCIREMHINDVIPELGSHQIFGTGLVNFIPYSGLMKRENVWLTFEVRPAVYAAESKRRFLEFIS